MYDIKIHRSGQSIPHDARRPLAQRLDRMTDRIWHKSPTFWVDDESLFREDSGLSLAEEGEEVVGFLVYRRVPVDDMLVLYLSGINVAPEHQGRGLLVELCKPILFAELQAKPAAPLYVSARTRNPIVLAETAKWCEWMVPDLGGGEDAPEHVARALRAAEVLFPGVELERPGMIYRNAYTDFSYRNPQHHSDPSIDAKIFRNADLSPADVFFMFGALRTAGR